MLKNVQATYFCLLECLQRHFNWPHQLDPGVHGCSFFMTFWWDFLHRSAQPRVYSLIWRMTSSSSLQVASALINNKSPHAFAAASLSQNLSLYPKIYLFLAFSYVSEIFLGYRERNNLSKLLLASWDFFFFLLQSWSLTSSGRKIVYIGTIPKLQQLPKLRASSAYVWLEQRLNIGCICVIQEKSNCVLSAALDWCTTMYGKTDPASISSPKKVNSGVKVENTNVFNFQSCSFQD